MAAAHPAALVIGADTIVVVGDEILGKPKTPQRSRAMLQKLQGRDHMVYTGVALVGPLGEETFAMGTKVRFAPMDEGEMEAYIATGEPFDKAGAYGIQGFGSAYIEGIEGDYYNVMGLPVQAIYQKLKNKSTKPEIRKKTFSYRGFAVIMNELKDYLPYGFRIELESRSGKGIRATCRF